MTPSIAVAPTPTVSTIDAERLSVKPYATHGDHVDGAWWPQSTDLVAELPGLLADLAERMGPIGRVVFHVNDWERGVSRIVHGHRVVRLDGYRYWPTGSIKLRAIGNAEPITLVVIPPATDPATARAVLAAAADITNTDAVGELLARCAQHPPTVGAS